MLSSKLFLIRSGIGVIGQVLSEEKRNISESPRNNLILSRISLDALRPMEKYGIIECSCCSKPTLRNKIALCIKFSLQVQFMKVVGHRRSCFQWPVSENNAD